MGSFPETYIDPGKTLGHRQENLRASLHPSTLGTNESNAGQGGGLASHLRLSISIPYHSMLKTSVLKLASTGSTTINHTYGFCIILEKCSRGIQVITKRGKTTEKNKFSICFIRF